MWRGVALLHVSKAPCGRWLWDGCGMTYALRLEEQRSLATTLLMKGTAQVAPGGEPGGGAARWRGRARWRWRFWCW